MFRKSTITFIAALILAGFTGCNSDSNGDNHLVLQTSVAVTGFSLQNNEKILNNLDSIFFAIDLNSAQIYNPDSLPLGTDISRLVVNISTDGVSTCQLKFKSRSGNDTIVDYLTDSTDSINFAAGPAVLHIISLDKANTRDYTIKVNVHKQKSDSLAWGKKYLRNLPSLFGVPANQKTVQAGETLYCITELSGKYSLATTNHPEKDWDIKEITFGFTPDLRSLAATENGTLYILADDGTLYRSDDKCAGWTSTGEKWFSIIGGYGESLLGVEQKAGIFFHTVYPSDNSAPAAIPADFPVEGMSQLYVYSSKWMTSPQGIMLGGRNYSGETTGTTWAYDGKNWACLSDNFPVKAADITVFPYYETMTDSVSWRTRKADALFALGGQLNDGSLQNTVYISKDLGFKWRKAEDVMQMPKYIPERYGAQAFVFTSVMTEREPDAQTAGMDENVWTIYPAEKLPSWWRIANKETLDRMTSRSGRAVKPVTEWHTPYIYMFGGYNYYGTLYNTVWRGAINTLTYKPLQ